MYRRRAAPLRRRAVLPFSTKFVSRTHDTKCLIIASVILINQLFHDGGILSVGLIGTRRVLILALINSRKRNRNRTRSNRTIPSDCSVDSEKLAAELASAQPERVRTIHRRCRIVGRPETCDFGCIFFLLFL